MRKYLILLLCFFCLYSAFAQSHVIETVYLKNGSMVRGMITEIVPGVSCTVKTSDGSIVVCNYPDITRITRELSETPSRQDKPRTSLKKEKGYEGLAELGYGVGSSKYGMNVLKFSFVNGYRVNPWLYTGLGIGLKSFSENSGIVLPVFADIRAQVPGKSVAPFIGISGGGGLSTSDNFFGVLVHSSLGVNIQSKGSMSWFVALGYDGQQMRFPDEDSWGIKNYLIRFSQSAGLNVGLTF